MMLEDERVCKQYFNQVKIASNSTAAGWVQTGLRLAVLLILCHVSLVVSSKNVALQDLQN